MKELLKLENVWKTFKNRPVLKGISFSVKKGEILGFVGPNGAGKTTTIRISLGLLKRDKGDVLLMGKDPFKDPKSREGVGAIFERPTFPLRISILKFLEHVAKLKGISIKEVNRVLKIVGLKGHEDKPFSSLSAGLKRRVALAHALLGNPELIIADEITSNLDPVERAKILDEVVELKKGHNVSFLISGHVLSEILRVADRLVVISRGRVIAQGTPSEIGGGRVIGRIRTPEPEKLTKVLRDYGLDAETRGVYVRVKIPDRENEKILYETLATASSKYNIRIYNVDLVEGVLEEILVESSGE